MHAHARGACGGNAKGGEVAMLLGKSLGVLREVFSGGYMEGGCAHWPGMCMDARC